MHCQYTQHPAYQRSILTAREYYFMSQMQQSIDQENHLFLTHYQLSNPTRAKDKDPMRLCNFFSTLGANYQRRDTFLQWLLTNYQTPEPTAQPVLTWQPPEDAAYELYMQLKKALAKPIEYHKTPSHDIPMDLMHIRDWDPAGFSAYWQLTDSHFDCMDIKSRQSCQCCKIQNRLGFHSLFTPTQITLAPIDTVFIDTHFSTLLARQHPSLHFNPHDSQWLTQLAQHPEPLWTHTIDPPLVRAYEDPDDLPKGAQFTYPPTPLIDQDTHKTYSIAPLAQISPLLVDAWRQLSQHNPSFGLWDALLYFYTPTDNPTLDQAIHTLKAKGLDQAWLYLMAYAGQFFPLIYQTYFQLFNPENYA